MKYRVKDPKKRNLVNELLSIENFKSSTPNPEIKVLFVVDTVTRAQIFLEAEPVQELADGWHPYPDEKPEKADELYIVAYKNNDNKDGYIDTRWFDGKVFDLWDSSIIAWQKRPKIWKEQE